jgi:pyruvate dehydrogenase E2 component (dihydrolipoamide acetyltransferase)
MTEFTIPELGENVAGGDVSKVLVKVGDTITRDQPVLELETDKATIEVPSSVAGVVKDIKVKAGDKVKVGAAVLSVEESGNGAGASAKADAPSRAEPAAAESKARQEKPAPQAAPEADRNEEPAKKPEKVVSMPQRSAPEAPARPSAPPPAPAPPRDERGPVVPASPSVRRLAREVGVGRISLEDVKEHARRILSSIGSTTGAGASARGERAVVTPLPDFAKFGEIERQPMSNIRRKTAEHLSQAWNTIPHVTQYDKADITALEELRKKFAPAVEKGGGKLTVTAILVRVLAAGVKRFPQFNASVDMGSHEVVLKKYVNVGVAVDTDRGLLVPVIRNADQKGITQISIEIQQIAEKARDKKLSLEDMSGGGISISNLGGIGGTAFTPIVNWPEVAILGVSRGHMEPVWKDGAFQPRLMLPLSLSYDHRLIDGADAIRFLRWVVDALEQPFVLAL